MLSISGLLIQQLANTTTQSNDIIQKINFNGITNKILIFEIVMRTQMPAIFNYIVVERNIEKYDIECWICHPYIHQAPKLNKFTKYADINVVNITWNLFFMILCFRCVKLTLNVGNYFRIYPIQ